ncbi:MAG: PP2C family protein-serine/threonine phosphatase, partial [Leptospira sp.]|nr:PP2C family protein-serine/threonine phosphatase [Leptospira sp.]
HGISSAMVASIMKVMVSTIPYRLKLSPAKLLDYMDERLYFDLNKYHASAVYLYFDFFSNFMRIANAGHPYMIHCPKNKEFYEIETEGAILGFNIRTPIATEQVVSFAPGDRFVIYTDGIIESVTASNEELGSVGFLEILNAHRSLTQLEDLQESILSDLRTRHGIQTFSDDTMFLLLEVDEYMEKSN